MTVSVVIEGLVASCCRCLFVCRQVTKKFKEFADSKRVRSTDRASMRELSQMIKKMPQYQKELNRYSTHLHMAEACMELCTKQINKMCKVEQVCYVTAVFM